jgi:alcohol dehydrogenase (cytochrome c)
MPSCELNFREGLGVKKILVGLALLAGMAGSFAGSAWVSDADKPESSPYAANCASCHGEALAGSSFAPALKGEIFQRKWQQAGAEALRDYIREKMPPALPGQLSAKDYETITAYLAKQNSLALAKPSAAQKPDAPVTEGDALRAFEENSRQLHDLIRRTNSATDNFDEEYRRVEHAREQTVAGLSPVNDNDLINAPDGDWVAWRRTLHTMGYSPLASINRRNVSKLTLAWSLSIAPGSGGIAPLVRNGVMFLNANGRVMALDGRTGDLLWQTVVSKAIARPPVALTQPRTMALYGTSLYVPTLDGHVLSLDARTGKIVWDTQVFEPGDGLQLTSGPIAARGKIFQGVSGCIGSYPGGCFIVALDAATGRKLWTFHTIARPGQAGGDSWNGAPLEKRMGGSVWIPGSYDPETNLLYFGTGQTYQTSQLLSDKPGAGKGAPRDALYTDATLALDPDTGRLVWYYQHLPGDVWDLDWSFERSIINFRGRKAIVTGGKAALFDVLDARTGAYLGSIDSGIQTFISAVDQQTGRKTINPDAVPGSGKKVTMCPSAIGGRNWPSTAYDPARGLLYVPIFESCMKITLDFVGTTLEQREDSKGKFGRITALDLGAGTSRWVDRRRAPPSSAVLTTGGGLLFAASLDRWFRAFDSDTGNLLWKARLADIPGGFPISYAVDGRQYVAIVTGGHTPLEGMQRFFIPEINDPGNGRAIWVFALGEPAISKDH